MRWLLAAAGGLLLLLLLAWRPGHTPASARPADPAAGAESAGGRASFGGVPAAAGKPGAATAAAAAGETVLAAGWGSGPGELGRRHDDESNPEMPMALVAGARGELALVDQVNRRIQRFVKGKLTGTIQLGGDTAQDIALAPGGHTVVLDRLADRNVQIYDREGKLLNEVPLAGKGIDEPGDVTGVFADEDGVFVERTHGSVVRIAGPSGDGDPDRPELLGRPSRDGRSVLQAEILRRSGQVMMRASDRATGELRWATPVELGAPILHILMLDSDRHGRVYLGALVGREEPDGRIADEHIVVVRVGANGAPAGMLRLPSLPGADETFRPLSVDDDGAVYLMMGTEAGLVVTRHTF